MQYSKQQVVDMFRRWGLTQLADQASRELTDPVDFDELQVWSLAHGLSHDDIISRLGGSP
jgi:hypothetical protein